MLTTFALAASPLHHPGWGMGPGPGFWITAAIFWLVLLGVVIALIATRRRRWARAGADAPWGPHGVGPWGGGAWGAGSWGAGQAAHNAETVLAERFARGDIDEVEYRARLEVLRSAQPPHPQG